MNIYEVQPIFSHPTHPFELTIDAPGSKSITNRALMLAALANGETLLKGALFSDDSRHFLQCLKDLGFDVVVDEPAHTVRVTGLGGRIPKETAAINVGSAGTAARFLTAMLGCAKGVWHLDASEQMKKRPMAALLNTLTDLGCRIDCDEKEGYFPFTIYSEGITASEATVDIGDSSQFLSALLMAAVMMSKFLFLTIRHGESREMPLISHRIIRLNRMYQLPPISTAWLSSPAAMSLSDTFTLIPCREMWHCFAPSRKWAAVLRIHRKVSA